MASKLDKFKLPRKYDRRCKTSDEDLIQMKRLYLAGMTQKAIADNYGVSQSTVSYAVSDAAKNNLANYRKRRPPKRRTKEESRNYQRQLRAYKKDLIEKENEE